MKKILFVCMAFAMLCCCSCTSENEDFETKTTTMESTSNVSKLTAQMRALHEGVSFRDMQDLSTRSGGFGWTKKDRTIIVSADACGGLFGFKRGGGLWGTILCAASSSAFAAVTTYFNLNIVPIVNHNEIMRTCNVQANETRNDSIGYFHNLIEYELIQQEPNLRSMSAFQLMAKTDSVASALLPSYLPLISQTVTARFQMTQGLNTLKNINTDSSMSFIEYIDALESSFPFIADEIEFMAQYIYDIYYANEDVDEYTRDIVWMIDHANGDGDMLALRHAVLIAYSSILYNNNTIVSNN